MKICGLDLSINSPGVFVLDLDDQLNVVGEGFRGFSTVQKNVNDNVTLMPKKFNDGLEKDLWVAERVVGHVSGCDFVAIEGPAYGAKGRLFEIGQAAGSVKYPLYKLGCSIRIIDPMSLKLFALGDGGANKLDVYNQFIQHKGVEYFERMKLPVVNKEDGVSPTSDIIDAYWLVQILLLELKLRRGAVHLKDYPENVVRVFNRVTKHYPSNILDTDFLRRKSELK